MPDTANDTAVPHPIRHWSTFPDGTEFNNDGIRPLYIPGFPDSTIDAHLDFHDRFSQADDACYDAMQPTARELAMLQLMEDFTDFDDWTAKVFDEAAMESWQTTAMTRPLISEAACRWCILELRDKAATYRSTKQFLTLNISAGICKSDLAVSHQLQEGLAQEMSSIRDRMTTQSDATQSHQIDPALFPLVFNRTLILVDGGQVRLDAVTDRVGQGRTICAHQTIAEDRVPGYSWSAESIKSQWLPFEAQFAEDLQNPQAVQIQSYINNVSPRHHPSFYHMIERLLSTAVGMWNDTLLKAAKPRQPRRIKTFGVSWSEQPWRNLPWIKDRDLLQDRQILASAVRYVEEYLSRPELPSEDPIESSDCTLRGYEDPLNPFQNPVKSFPNLEQQAADFPDLLLDKWARLRTWYHPEPGVAFSYEQWKRGETAAMIVPMNPEGEGYYDDASAHEYYTVALEKTFRKQGIQIVAKASSVELAPSENSTITSFPGSEWELAGLLNEHIVATAQVYYSVENVTCPSIRFQQQVNNDERVFVMNNGDQAELYDTFGWGWHEDLFQNWPWWRHMELGSITLRTGRILAWPNVLSTRLEPFALQDMNRPGHVRWLTLYLVDPHYRIISTRNVPPQQDWWLKDALEAADLGRHGLPQELIDHVADYLKNWPMSMEEAMEHKRDMEYERGPAPRDDA